MNRTWVGQMSSYFQDFTQYDFEDWLRTGLERQSVQHMKPKAFPGASAELACHDFLAEGLAAAYSRLPPDKQSFFRLAVADLINSWEIIEDNATSLKHLLHLATLLPAKELLRGLPAWIKTGHFQRLPPALANDLFDEIFLTVTRLVAPTRVSVDCLRELIALPQFRTDWAGMALESLWWCDSNNVAHHFQRLRPYLRELMAGADYRPQRWAKRMLDRVGLYRIVQDLPTLKHSDGDDGDWLIEGLLFVEQPPVEYSVDKDGNLRFRLTGKPGTEETPPKETRSNPRTYPYDHRHTVSESAGTFLTELFPEDGEAASRMLYPEISHAA